MAVEKHQNEELLRFNSWTAPMEALLAFGSIFVNILWGIILKCNGRQAYTKVLVLGCNLGLAVMCLSLLTDAVILKQFDQNIHLSNDEILCNMLSTLQLSPVLATLLTTIFLGLDQTMRIIGPVGYLGPNSHLVLASSGLWFYAIVICGLTCLLFPRASGLNSQCDLTGVPNAAGSIILGLHLGLLAVAYGVMYIKIRLMFDDHHRNHIGNTPTYQSLKGGFNTFKVFTKYALLHFALWLPFFITVTAAAVADVKDADTVKFVTGQIGYCSGFLGVVFFILRHDHSEKLKSWFCKKAKANKNYPLRPVRTM